MKTIAWFSCGAASAVASKIAAAQFPEVEIVNCDTRPSEHSDNYRFSAQCEEWFGKKIIYIRNAKYDTVDDVFERESYMAGVRGARCTTELKKIPRLEFVSPDDVHIWGFTADEPKRIREFQLRNPELKCRFLLAEIGVTKQDCYDRLTKVGIELPVMYQLGFDNNNCPGCVKASSPWYWSMVRKHFPEVFKRRCEQSRAIGVRLVEIHHHERIFLDELPHQEFKKRGKKRENLSCGPECASK